MYDAYTFQVRVTNDGGKLLGMSNSNIDFSSRGLTVVYSMNEQASRAIMRITYALTSVPQLVDKYIKEVDNSITFNEAISRLEILCTELVQASIGKLFDTIADDADSTVEFGVNNDVLYRFRVYQKKVKFVFTKSVLKCRDIQVFRDRVCKYDIDTGYVDSFRNSMALDVMNDIIDEACIRDRVLTVDDYTNKLNSLFEYTVAISAMEYAHASSESNMKLTGNAQIEEEYLSLFFNRLRKLGSANEACVAYKILTGTEHSILFIDAPDIGADCIEKMMLAKLITLYAQERNIQIIVRTQDPYIIGEINNAVYAGRLGYQFMSEADSEEKSVITGYSVLGLDSERFKVLNVNACGNIDSLCDSTGIICNERGDAASLIINFEFTMLYDRFFATSKADEPVEPEDNIEYPTREDTYYEILPYKLRFDTHTGLIFIQPNSDNYSEVTLEQAMKYAKFHGFEFYDSEEIINALGYEIQGCFKCEENNNRLSELRLRK